MSLRPRVAATATAAAPTPQQARLEAVLRAGHSLGTNLSAREKPLYLFHYNTDDGHGWRECFTYRDMRPFMGPMEMDVSSATHPFWTPNVNTQMLGFPFGHDNTVYDNIFFDPNMMRKFGGRSALIKGVRSATPEDMVRIEAAAPGILAILSPG
jgi:ribosomal protein L31